jgi:hypothetical protein
MKRSLSIIVLKSKRILLSIVAYHDYKIWKMDIKIIFLNGNLQEDVYVTQPESFEYNKFFNKVCNL